MTARELSEQVATIREQAFALQEMWESLIAGFLPPHRQFNAWLLRFGFTACCLGIQRTAVKYSQLNGDMTPDFLLRYTTATIRQKAEQER